MISQAQWWLASGAIGSEKRTKPYAPCFSMIAASTTEPPVGASTWAAGNHVCTGHIGTLTENAARNAKNSSVCACIESLVACQARMSKLPLDLMYRKTMATSISSEPSSVYRKNLNDA